MKKTFLNFLGGCTLFLSATAVQAQQGLEGIIVEEFHTVTQADADFVNNDLGNSSYTLNPGSKVYRIYVDMAPGYRMVSVFASPAATLGGTDSPNPLTIQTTTNFWNDDNFGSSQPAQTRRVDEGTLFDSFITSGTTGTAGGAAGCGLGTAQLGVPRSQDPDGDLTTCGVYPGFTGTDGSYAGTAPALTTNLGGTINFAALTEDASTFTFIDDVWATLPPISGFDPQGQNLLLVGQFTTDGDFSFQINVAVADQDNNLEEYVHTSAAPGQFQRDFLTFPQVGTPDCLGVIGGPALPGTPCDDGLATTGNDVYDVDCNCAGELIDCLGVAGGTALPGTTCDDGNANTGNDVYGADCVCAGQPLDCLGVPGGTAVIGSPCDDGLATTGNDVYGADCVCAGELIDCLGVAGGTTLPGTPCDDGNPNSTNDVYGADCVCAGTLAEDCLGVPGGTAQPGTPCDDGNANTGNDVYGVDCVCAGEPLDCLGVPGGTAVLGSPCDDGLATTGNDVYGDDCVCAGEVIDCLGVAGGTALPGTACDDGNPNSTNDVYGADCVCAGTLAEDCLGVPGGTAQPGTPCDDGNANTGNDVYGADCVCAGELIDCLGVAGGSALPGTACDDNDANTINDVYGADCVCAGTPAGTLDCEGVLNGPAVPGTPCDDGNAGTGNDVYDVNCTCAGQPLDCEGVPGGTAFPGTPCDDGLATTGSDVYGVDCECAGQLIDCLGVAGGSALPGTSCNDGNAATINDAYDANCQCVGTPIGDCTEVVTLEIQTDNAPGETSWEIIPEGGGAVLCGGSGPYAAGSSVTESCCLPVGCYALRVLDSAGDGIANGGYVLREEASGLRIIDNSANFSSGSGSAISGGQGFCLPIGTDQPIASSCDKLDWVTNRFIVAAENVDVSAQFGVTNTTSGYEFWFFDPNGSYSFRRFRNHATSDGFGTGALRANHFKLNKWINTALTPHLPEGVLLNVRIRGRVAGENLAFGPACQFKMDAARAACPLTQLLDQPGSSISSCGATRNFGNGNFVYAKPPQFLPAVPASMLRYQFRFRNTDLGFETIRQSNNYILPLNWTGATALQCGVTYTVDVRVSKDMGATWCIDTPTPTAPFTPWGTVCSVTINPCGAATPAPLSASINPASLTLYPNPNRGDQLNMVLSAVEEGVNTVSVDIYDLFGKRVSARTIAVNDGMINTVLDLNGDLAAGMYLVNITAGEAVYTERLVVQP